MIKKILLVTSVVLVAVVIFGAGFAFSQFQPALAQAGVVTGMRGFSGHGGMMGWRGGVTPDYMEQALGEKLGLTEAQVEEQLSAGKSMYQIALDNGTAEGDVAALLETVHKTALDKAVAAGVLTQADADAMLAQMKTYGFDGTYQNGGMRGMMGWRGGGAMQDYVEKALGEKLGLTEAQVEEQLSAGKSMYQIALDNGTAEGDVAALLETVHKTAFDKAVAAGVLTQADADAMLAQMKTYGFDGTYQNGGIRGGMRGAGRGNGGMMGWRGQQNQP